MQTGPANSAPHPLGLPFPAANPKAGDQGPCLVTCRANYALSGGEASGISCKHSPNPHLGLSGSPLYPNFQGRSPWSRAACYVPGQTQGAAQSTPQPRPSCL